MTGHRIAIVLLAALLGLLAWWLVSVGQRGCDPLQALPWLRCAP